MKKDKNEKNYVEIGKLIKIFKGRKVEITSTVPGEGLLPIINIENVRGIAPTLFSYHKGVLCNKSDILIVWDGANAGTVGTNLEGIIGSTIAKIELESKEEVYYEYLFYFIKSKFEYLNQSTTGATIPHLDRSKLLSLRVQLPSIENQKKICDVLKKAEQTIEKRKEADALMDEYLQSMFIEMFGDPVNNPKGWEVRKFGTIVTDIQAGWSIGGEARNRNEDEFGVLKISAVTGGRFIASEHKAVKKEDVVKKIITPQRGDLLFSRANTRELVAATCIVEENYPQLFLPDKLWRIIPDTKKVYGEYLKCVLSHSKFRENLAQNATGSSGSMLNISMEKLREIYLPIPPLSLQEKFREIFWSIYKLQVKARKSEVALESLFKSLQNDFFTNGKRCEVLK